MVDVKNQVGNRALAKPTVFTASIRSFTYEVPRPDVHALVVQAYIKSSGLRLQEADNLGVVEVGSILPILFFGQLAQIGFTPECFNAFAKFAAKVPSNELPGGIRSEPSGCGVKKLV
jgi:hypothetical protein